MAPAYIEGASEGAGVGVVEPPAAAPPRADVRPVGGHGDVSPAPTSPRAGAPATAASGGAALRDEAQRVAPATTAPIAAGVPTLEGQRLVRDDGAVAVDPSQRPRLVAAIAGLGALVVAIGLAVRGRDA